MMDLKFTISIQERGTGVIGESAFLAWGGWFFNMSSQRLPLQRKGKKKST